MEFLTESLMVILDRGTRNLFLQLCRWLTPLKSPSIYRLFYRPKHEAKSRLGTPVDFLMHSNPEDCFKAGLVAEVNILLIA